MSHDRGGPSPRRPSRGGSGFSQHVRDELSLSLSSGFFGGASTGHACRSGELSRHAQPADGSCESVTRHTSFVMRGGALGVGSPGSASRTDSELDSLGAEDEKPVGDDVDLSSYTVVTHSVNGSISYSPRYRGISSGVASYTGTHRQIPNQHAGERIGGELEWRMQNLDLNREHSNCRFPVFVSKETLVRPRYYQLISDSRFGIVKKEWNFLIDPMPWGYYSYFDCRKGDFVYHNWKTNRFQDEAPVGVRNWVMPEPLNDPSRRWESRMDPSQSVAYATREQLYKNVEERKSQLSVAHMEGQRRTKMSAHTRSIYGDEMNYWLRVRAANAVRSKKMKHKPAAYLGGVHPGITTGKTIRRRALLIACCYENAEANAGIGPESQITENMSHHERDRVLRTREIDAPSRLKYALSDLQKVYTILVSKRNFEPSEIVVLTDGSRSSEFLKSLERKGVKIEDSSYDNIVRWLCMLGSDLRSDVPGLVTSLFLYFAGHGDSRPEFSIDCELSPEEQAIQATEEDLRDEMILCSNYKRVWIGPRDAKMEIRDQEKLVEYEESGAVVDDVINRLLVGPVFRTPNCQLVCIFDACMSGSILDLPMTLDDKEDVWRASGQVRRDEMFSGIRPMEWDCGEGLVFCVSAAQDYQLAADHRGGFLTKALVESGLNETGTGNSLSIGSFIANVRDSVARSNEQLRQRGIVDTHAELQQPVLSSSHFCSLSTPLVL